MLVEPLHSIDPIEWGIYGDWLEDHALDSVFARKVALALPRKLILCHGKLGERSFCRSEPEFRGLPATRYVDERLALFPLESDFWWLAVAKPGSVFARSPFYCWYNWHAEPGEAPPEIHPDAELIAKYPKIARLFFESLVRIHEHEQNQS